jgi:hypothetical protein
MHHLYGSFKKYEKPLSLSLCGVQGDWIGRLQEAGMAGWKVDDVLLLLDYNYDSRNSFLLLKSTILKIIRMNRLSISLLIRRMYYWSLTKQKCDLFVD